VLFASDHPFLPMERALAAARQLPLESEAMNDFLGDAAARILEGRAGG
jgi:predicted TIM-barrel fold metal-dependent hydrolase